MKRAGRVAIDAASVLFGWAVIQYELCMERTGRIDSVGVSGSVYVGAMQCEMRSGGGKTGE